MSGDLKSKSGDVRAKPANMSVIVNGRQLLRKIDLRIMPIIVGLYLMAFLTRINLANAYLAITDDQEQANVASAAADNQTTTTNETILKVTPSDYTWIVAVYFISYTLLQIPSNACMKRFHASKWLTFLCFGWGVVAACESFVTSVTELLVVRFVLGAIQAGIFPGILYYLTLWYREDERGLRFSIIFAASLIASSFSGLVAFGVLRMDGILGYRGWQWLFFLEGAPSVFFAVLVYMCIPDSPNKAKWLSDAEKEECSSRLSHSSLPTTASDNTLAYESDLNGEEQVLLTNEEVFDDASTIRPGDDIIYTFKSEFWYAMSNPILWVFALFYLSLSIPNAALNFFLPKIVALFGFDIMMSNLITAPIYLLTAVTTLFWSRNSDKTQERKWHLIIPCVLCMLSFILLSCFTPKTGLLTSETPVWVALIITTMTVIGSAPLIPLSCTWLSQSIPKDRPILLAIGTGQMVSIGQLSG